MRYKFLHWLRGIGVCLIVYDHLGPLRNTDWFLSRLMEASINRPLGIIQCFGAFAVCLFFIISGFLLTTRASKGWQFICNKFIRILVTLVFSTVLFWLFNKLISILWGPTYWDQFSVADWLESATLFCYVLGKDSVINGAIWYLFPLLFVEIVWAIFYRIAKKNVVYMAVILDVIFVILIVLTELYNYRLAQMQWLIFSLVPVFGILIRAIYEERVSILTFITLFAIDYLVFLIGIRIFRPSYYIEQPFLISLIYAVLFFCVLLASERRLKLPPIVKFLSDISFSIYLMHMPYGGLLMTIFEENFRFTICFIIAFALVIILAWGQYYWIEKRIVEKLKLKKSI